MVKKPNLIVVIADTLRVDYLGCYGNGRIRTPHIEAFARDAALFDSCYPEVLPTIPYRRSFHTGRRIFPIRTWKPLKWDIVNLPGWQPMDNAEDTLAENLADRGYYTGFVTDTLPYFAPGMNFTRGFWQWHYVRGMQQDRWKSPAIVPREKIANYGDPDEEAKKLPGGLIARHLANTAHEKNEEDTRTAQVFRWAAEFVEQNTGYQPIYLLADSFAPHEPWEAPPSYLRLYADPNYAGRTALHIHYAEIGGQLNEEELRHVQAHYAGLVSLVDTWFGRLIDTIKRVGLYDNSVIVFTSDHGTNFADNPRRILGKPHHAMYPGVVHVPLLIRFPGGAGSGKRFDELVYNTDIVATLYHQSGVAQAMGSDLSIDGSDLTPLIHGGGWHPREYLTSRYRDSLWYRDHENFVLMDLDGVAGEVFDPRSDPRCRNNLVEQRHDEVKMAYERAMQDAGGELPDYRGMSFTDAIGQR